MQFRKANQSDASCIMNIINEAQFYFKEHGIDQWQNNYPNIEIIKNDIENNNGFVLVKDKKIIGTVAVTFDGEKNYAHIYEGKWIRSQKYAAIHRIAVDSDYKGMELASVIIKNIEKMCLNKDIHSIRVDTHKDNISMQKLLHKNMFNYCGIIYLEDKSERIAFEKII